MEMIQEKPLIPKVGTPFTETPKGMLISLRGFVISAINQPDTDVEIWNFFPGIYYPGDRDQRIAGDRLEPKNDWDYRESIQGNYKRKH